MPQDVTGDYWLMNTDSGKREMASLENNELNLQVSFQSSQ